MPHLSGPKPGKFMKPVADNNMPECECQFKVKTDTDNFKKVKPSKVFQNYKPLKNNKK